jgi:hypothetical protein
MSSTHDKYGIVNFSLYVEQGVHRVAIRYADNSEEDRPASSLEEHLELVLSLTRTILAGTDAGSLPNDFPVDGMAAERMKDLLNTRRQLELAHSAERDTEAWPTKEDYLSLVEINGRIVNAWKALREHIGNDVLPSSRFERLIWLMQGACDSVKDAPASSAPAMDDAYIGLKGTADALLRDADLRIAEREAQLDAIAKELDVPKESWRIAGCDVLAHQVKDLRRSYIALRDKTEAPQGSSGRQIPDEGARPAVASLVAPLSSVAPREPVAWQIIGKQSGEVISVTADPHEMKLAVEGGHLIRGLYTQPIADLSATRAQLPSAEFLMDDRFTGKFIENYVDDYGFEGDDGYHQPTESEKILLMDCCVGLLTEILSDEFTKFCESVLRDSTDRGGASG